MSEKPSVTIVGNGVAGFACARDLAAGGARVTLIGPGLPCDRPPLSKRALLAGRAPLLATADELAVCGIAHIDGMATDLDLRARRLAVGARSMAFEHLVWATGLRSVRPPIPGIDLAGEISDLAGFEQLRESLGSPGHVVVVGAGLIGVETAATLSAMHRVTLVERATRPLERFHPDVASAALAVLEDSGIEFIGGCQIDRIDAIPGGRRRLAVADRDSLVADVVIVAAGVTSTLPAALGDGACADVDHRLAVPGEDAVWVCGDLARYRHPRHGPVSVPHWDNARAGGRHVAAAILGSHDAYSREPYWFSDIGPLRIQSLGCDANVREWRRREDLLIGTDDAGKPRCVLMMNAPTRLPEARRLLAA